jgi:hypothetical protein
VSLRGKDRSLPAGARFPASESEEWPFPDFFCVNLVYEFNIYSFVSAKCDFIIIIIIITIIVVVTSVMGHVVA